MTQQVEIDRRLSYSGEKLNEVRDTLKSLVTGAISDNIPYDSYSVYATGSFGRYEASKGSDLDTFIVGVPYSRDGKPNFPKLDQKILIGRIIEAIRQVGLPDLDRDGEFIRYYSTEDLVKNIGLPDDEVENTFTARLLLLLESTHVSSQEAHDVVLEHVIGTYWRDYDQYADSFRPTFVMNDILKYWRVLCVDYESKMTADYSDIEDRRLSRKSKNLKLRYNRMMTCFSAIAAFADIYGKHKTIPPEKAFEICKMSPIQRLKAIGGGSNNAEVRKLVEKLILDYGIFLELSARGKEQMQKHFSLPDKFEEERKRADTFGGHFYELIKISCSHTDLFRYLIV